MFYMAFFNWKKEIYYDKFTFSIVNIKNIVVDFCFRKGKCIKWNLKMM